MSDKKFERDKNNLQPEIVVGEREKSSVGNLSQFIFDKVPENSRVSAI